MRGFVTAFIVLSIVVMAQSVIAVTPGGPSSTGLQLEVFDQTLGQTAGASASLAVDQAAIGGAPNPIAIWMLLTGISGLAAAGSLPSRSSDSARPFGD